MQQDVKPPNFENDFLEKCGTKEKFGEVSY
jgi:hypothetical protein